MAEEGFKAGSAYVELDVDAEPAIAKTEKAIRNSKGQFVKAGTEVGEALGKGIDDGASKETSRSPKLKKATEQVAARSQAVFEGMKFAGAFGGLPIAAAGASALTIGAFAAIPTALVSAAAKANAGIDSVSDAYARLADTSVNVFQRSASVLQDELVSGTDDLTRSMVKLEPAMTGAFRNAAPAVDGLVDAATTLVDEALPGILTGTTKTNQAMQGLENFAKGAGRGVTDFFQNSARGADASVASMTVFGSIVQDAAGFLGTLTANLNIGAASVLPMFRNALSQVYGILTQLTGGGMAPLVSGVSAFITVVSGALGVVSAFTGTLGGWLGPLAAVFGAFKAVDMLTFGKLTASLATQFDGLGSSIRTADGARGKFQAGMSGLVSAAISPAGLATAGLVIGLGILGMAQQRAAQAAAEHKARVGDLAAALRESNGAINDNTRAAAAKALGDMEMSNSGKSVLQVARELGVSLPDLTSAYLGNEAAQKRVNTQLEARGGLAADKVLHGEKATDQERAEAIAATALGLELKGTNTEYGKAVQHNKDLTAASAGTTSALTKLTPAQQAAAISGDRLAAAWTTMYTPLATVSDRANALIAILDRLSGRTPSFEEAIQSNNDLLRGMADSLSNAEFAADGFGQALLNSDGTISTWTKNGSDLQNTAVGLQSGFANAGASIQELTTKGMTFDAASQKVNATLTTQRNEFIKNATTMGLTADEAAKLADKYGLIPEQVTTKVTDLGSAVTTQSDVDKLDAKLKGLPPDTPVRITSLSDEAQQKLNTLGYTVTTMPDGSTTVTAHTQDTAIVPIQGVADRMLALQDRTVTLNVRTVFTTIGTPAPVRGEATAAFSHDGGRIGPRAYSSGPRERRTGGHTPFIAGMANATKVGETGPEIIFPSRSAYVATAVQTKRMETAAGNGAQAAPASGRGGTAVLDRPGWGGDINVYPPATIDFEALATKVSRIVERKMKGGA